MKGLLLAILAWPALAQQVTYSEHVAPILFQYCVSCHRPGEAAPFPLLTYDEARKHAQQIVEVTKRRYMPPWPPAPGYGDFVGARRLSDVQLDLLAQWAQNGTPQGDPAKAPLQPEFTPGWQLGPPDVILRMSAPYQLTAKPGDVFRNFVIPTTFKETRYVRALELHPGNKRVVHHANVVVDRLRTLRYRDREDGQPGFPGMEVETEAGEEFDPDSHFLFWKPGTVVEPEPSGMAWRLEPGTDLIVNLHLQPSGKPETILAEVGLYFTDQQPTLLPMLVQLEHDGAINVPPGANQFGVTDHLRFPVAADVLAIYPHAHYIGKKIEAWATLPGGMRKPLLRIDDWDINWQAAYHYTRPVSLPAGSTVAMRISYDNTSTNPRNPSQPPVRVRAGNRSQDEMGHVWLQLLPRAKDGVDGRLLFQEAVMRRRLEKYPADFFAHFNLGSALIALGKTEEGLKYLGTAAQMRPGNVAALNGYGAALVLTERLEPARAEFQRALRLQPSYTSARFNLARVVAAQGDVAGAVEQLEILLKDDPTDARAHYLMAGILAQQGRYAAATPHFRQAASALVNDPDVQTNYGTVLAMQGDLPGAISAFERALKLKPDHTEARANLERAKETRNRRNQ